MASKTSPQPDSSLPVPGKIAERPVAARRSPRRTAALLCLLLAVLLLVPLVRGRVLRSLQAGSYLEQGRQLLAAGRVQEAEQAWQEAARIAPDNPNVYRALYALYRAQSRMPEAREAVNRLADLAPHEPHLLCEFTAEELRLSPQGMYEATARDALRAVQLEPNCVRALTLAGETAQRKGDDKQAIAYLRRAVQVKPEDVPLTLHLINVMLEANDSSGALEVARDLTRRYPGYAQGYAMVGVAAGAFPQGSPLAVEAETALQTALRLDPTNALAHIRLGSLYIASGNASRALPHLEAARLLGYERPALLFQLSVAYRAVGRVAEAARMENGFRRLSTLESEISALEKQEAMDPENSSLKQRVKAAKVALAEAQRLERAARDAELRAEKPAAPTGRDGNAP